MSVTKKTGEQIIVEGKLIIPLHHFKVNRCILADLDHESRFICKDIERCIHDSICEARKNVRKKPEYPIPYDIRSEDCKYAEFSFKKGWSCKYTERCTHQYACKTKNTTSDAYYPDISTLQIKLDPKIIPLLTPKHTSILLEALYLGGFTDHKIEKALFGDRPPFEITRWRKKRGLKPNPINYRMVEELYRLHLNDRIIAEELEIGIDAVRNWRKRNGLPTQTELGVSLRGIDYSEVEHLYYEGKSDSEIADTLNIGKSTVYKWRVDNNLPSKHIGLWVCRKCSVPCIQMSCPCIDVSCIFDIPQGISPKTCSGNLEKEFEWKLEIFPDMKISQIWEKISFDSDENDTKGRVKKETKQ